MMQKIVLKNYEELSEYTADVIVKAIEENPRLVLCMASGSSPALACELLTKKLKEKKVDYSKLTFIGLDEWAALSPTNAGSCHYFFQTKIFQPLDLSPSQCHLFDAQADLTRECEKMDKLIADKGGIDLMAVGIGMNGHIGFNEPGASFQSLSHVTSLAEITKSVGQQKYFSSPVTLEQGITIGLGHLMNAKKVILMANGNKKAAVIQQAMECPPAENFPASIMQQHPNGFIVLDQEAAHLLKK